MWRDVPDIKKKVSIVFGILVFAVLFFMFFSPSRSMFPLTGIFTSPAGSVMDESVSVGMAVPSFYERDTSYDSGYNKGMSSGILPPEPYPGRSTVDPSISRQVIRSASLSLLVKKAEDA